MPITLTTKRQATFPKALCDELKVGPGDEILLERKLVDRETVWILRPRQVDWSWIGSMRPRKRVSHDIEAIRASITRARDRARR